MALPSGHIRRGTTTGASSYAPAPRSGVSSLSGDSGRLESSWRTHPGTYEAARRPGPFPPACQEASRVSLRGARKGQTQQISGHAQGHAIRVQAVRGRIARRCSMISLSTPRTCWACARWMAGYLKRLVATSVSVGSSVWGLAVSSRTHGVIAKRGDLGLGQDECVGARCDQSDPRSNRNAWRPRFRSGRVCGGSL